MDLQEQLVEVRKELDVAQDRHDELFSKFIDNKTELQRERLINQIALRYIPEELEGEYYAACPHGQPV
jgi:ABC-type siderophore export system fused ATPase/permease subunit